MTVHPRNLGARAGIGTGFIVILLLMGALGGVGIRYAGEANSRMQSLVHNNSVKIQLATEMQSALRERALTMQVILVLKDPFERDAATQRFHGQGGAYLRARNQLEQMPLSAPEILVLANIGGATREALPYVREVLELAQALGTDTPNAAVEQMRDISMAKQRAIATEVGVLLDMQRALASTAGDEATLAYQRVRGLMLGLGAAAMLIGIGVALFVSRRADSQSRQLAIQASTDPLTGLANRSLMQDRIEVEIKRASRFNTSFGVVLMDLDRFKGVNDALGHEVGDEVLREVGRRLLHAVRDEDTVARLGGDEYVLIVRGLAEGNVRAIAAKVREALDKPFYWQNQSIDLSASLGVALYPAHAQNSSGLLRCADIAMYAAKRAGDGCKIYSVEQECATREDLSLKSELREAIHNNELVLYYQPKIDHFNKRVSGLEALVRWDHPQRGFLTPDKFIPLAEEAGMIGMLTHWVLKTGLAQLTALRLQGYDLGIAVNLSARSLDDMDLPATVRTLLSESGLAPAYLTLEITESAVMANPSTGLAILHMFDSMGVALAIDDFGTGYSSLSYLKRLPVDELKIDKSFVVDMATDVDDAVIVRSTIDLAHNLGLKVTAEGVETQGAWDRLSALGCDQSQGYFMSRPLSAAQLDVWLQESAWAAGALAGTGPGSKANGGCAVTGCGPERRARCVLSAPGRCGRGRPLAPRAVLTP